MKSELKTYSDCELLEKYAQNPREELLVELYGRYLPLVYGVALKYLKNIPDAQDVVMQIWEELFEKVLRQEIKVFKSWLYVCVRNHCLMELRKRSGNFSLQLDEEFMEFCDDFNPMDEEFLRHQETALKACMEALPENQRLCIQYFYMEEHSYKEIEKVSGFSLKMVKSCVQNGKRNLRICLEKKGIRK